LTRIDFKKFNNNEVCISGFIYNFIKSNYLRKNPVLCLVPSEEIKEKISNILWTQEPESFLPHSTSRSKELINISDKPEPLDHSNLLINFNDKSCDWFSRFDSVTEIIISDPTNIKAKQKSYTHYKRFGYEVAFEDLTVINS